MRWLVTGVEPDVKVEEKVDTGVVMGGVVKGITVSDGLGLAANDLTVMTPGGGSAVVSDLTFSVPPNKNLIISGASGSGKSSLLRAVAGLWTEGSGEVVREADVVFLPQKPYCPLGNLSEQVGYGARGMVTEGEKREALVKVGLGKLAEGGLEVTRDWSTELR